METIFTNYLLDQGWRETAPMCYKKEGLDLEIFFDTSNQIVVYDSQGRVKDVYLACLHDLVKALQDVIPSN